MKYAMIGSVLAVALGGCNANVPVPVPVPMPALLKLDGTNLAKACVRVNTAIGYFNNLSFLIPEPYRTGGILAVSAASDICTPASQAALLASGKSIVNVITKLDGIWQQVQANTKAN